MSVPQGSANGLNYLSFAWRVSATGLSYAIFGSVCLLAAFAFSVIIALTPGISTTRRRRWARAVIRHLSHFFIHLMRFLGLMRLRLENIQRLDTSGELIVANHPSLIDALYVMAYTPRLCCVVKPALFRNPCTAYLVRAAGYLRSDSADLLEQSASAVMGGDNLLLFPEGTRNTDDTTLAFRRGAAYVALAARCPVRPVTIDYHPRTLQKGARWYAVPSRVVRVSIKVLATVQPRRYPGAEFPVTLAARHFTRDIRDVFVRETRGFRRFAVDTGANERAANVSVPSNGMDGHVS